MEVLSNGLLLSDSISHLDLPQKQMLKPIRSIILFQIRDSVFRTLWLATQLQIVFAIHKFPHLTSRRSFLNNNR